MPKVIAIVSQFHNLSAGDLVDPLGALKAQSAELEARKRALRDEQIRRGVPVIEGAVHDVTITEAVRCTLDPKAVKTRGRRLVRRAVLAGAGHVGQDDGPRRFRRADRGIEKARHGTQNSPTLIDTTTPDTLPLLRVQDRLAWIRHTVAAIALAAERLGSFEGGAISELAETALSRLEKAERRIGKNRTSLDGD